MKILFLISAVLAFLVPNAQPPAQLIGKGNEQYRKKDYAKAGEIYSKALSKEANNAIALFNAGNANHRLKQYAAAAENYEAAAASSNDPLLKAQAYYNLGLARVGQQQLAGAIDAFKQSLRLNPNDNETRENLQKALKQVQQQQQQKDDPKNNRKKSKEKPKPQKQAGRLSEEEAEKMLDELRREEKNLQKEVQRKNQSSRQLKDW